MKRFLAVVTLLGIGLWIAGCEPAASTKPDAGKGTPAMEGSKGGPPPGAGGLDPAKAATDKAKDAAKDEEKKDEEKKDEEKKDEEKKDEAPADGTDKKDDAPAEDADKKDEGDKKDE